MKFSDIPQETIDLKNSYWAKYKNDIEPTDSEREAYNLYHRLYRLQAHRNKPSKEFSKTWKQNNIDRHNAHSRKWAEKNREEMKGAVERWQSKNSYKIGKG